MSEPAPNTDWQEWFERVWAHREEVLYPSLFGKERRGIFPIQAGMLTGMFKQATYDPRWLHYGVIEFSPTPSRASWLYVTSGMSNDWEAEKPDTDTPSGLGCEFVLETTRQSEWAIVRLQQLMVFQILLCHGRYPGSEPLGDYHRLPLRGPICPGHSVLTHLMLAPPTGFKRAVELESGPFDFYQAVGISEAEVTFARSHGGSALVAKLMEHQAFPVIDPDRAEVTPV